MKIIDLTHFVEHHSPSFPGSSFPKVIDISKIEADGYREKMLTISSHVGTHVDAPAHIIKNGRRLDEYDASVFYGKGVSVFLGHEKQNETLEQVQQYLRQNPDVMFILFCSGWDKYWKNEKYFSEYPCISTDLAECLAESPINCIGIDTPSVDPLLSTNYEIHKILFRKNKFIIENMTGLDNLVNKNFTLCCFPLRIKEADGSPVRAVAILDE